MNREILKKKLSAGGFCSDIYDWLDGYLKDRQKFGNVNGAKSDIRIIIYGVPQGSLLGPRLFSIHVNDLTDFVKSGILFMFADDTTIYCTGKNVEEVIDKLNKASSELYEWCMCNQLTVHTGKTEAVILKANAFIGPLRPIMFGNAVIKYATNSTCLGIVIDNRLIWTKQHEKVMKSFSAKVKNLKDSDTCPEQFKSKYITKQ